MTSRINCLNHTIKLEYTSSYINMEITNKNTQNHYRRCFQDGGFKTSKSLIEVYNVMFNAFNNIGDYYSEIIEKDGQLKLFIFAVDDCFYFKLEPLKTGKKAEEIETPGSDSDSDFEEPPKKRVPPKKTPKNIPVDNLTTMLKSNSFQLIPLIESYNPNCGYYLKSDGFYMSNLAVLELSTKDMIDNDGIQRILYENLPLFHNLEKLTISNIQANAEFNKIKHNTLSELVLDGTIGAGFTSIAGFDVQMPNLQRLTIINAHSLTNIAETLYNCDCSSLKYIYLKSCSNVDERLLHDWCKGYKITLHVEA